jgi:alkanesulfonate monooxygenase
MHLRFHWRLVQGGQARATSIGPQRVAAGAGLPDLEGQVNFSEIAQRCGIDSLLVDMTYGRPDPMTLGLSLALATRGINFMIAARPGLMSPTLFVQQVNTFSALTNGRISLNVVAGHSPGEQRSYGDHLQHDDRYARMNEWLEICGSLWDAKGPVTYSGQFYRISEGRLNTPFVSPNGSRPEIFVGGNSSQAKEIALRHADCWLRFGDTPERIAEQAAPLRQQGRDVGLRLSIACRESRALALSAAQAPLADVAAQARAGTEGQFVRQSDAVSMREAYALGETEWLTPRLWAGSVRLLGASSLCLLGTPEDVAAELLAFRAAGVTHFILSGWPTGEELLRFGRDVLPLVRKAEDECRITQPPSPKSSARSFDDTTAS